jgi:hypothetical protein
MRSATNTENLASDGSATNENFAVLGREVHSVEARISKLEETV